MPELKYHKFIALRQFRICIKAGIPQKCELPVSCRDSETTMTLRNIVFCGVVEYLRIARKLTLKEDLRTIELANTHIYVQMREENLSIYVMPMNFLLFSLVKYMAGFRSHKFHFNCNSTKDTNTHRHTNNNTTTAAAAAATESGIE